MWVFMVVSSRLNPGPKKPKQNKTKTPLGRDAV
jgi:hypothetical protein